MKKRINLTKNEFLKRNIVLILLMLFSSLFVSAQIEICEPCPGPPSINLKVIGDYNVTYEQCGPKVIITSITYNGIGIPSNSSLFINTIISDLLSSIPGAVMVYPAVCKKWVCPPGIKNSDINPGPCSLIPCGYNQKTCCVYVDGAMGIPAENYGLGAFEEIPQCTPDTTRTIDHDCFPFCNVGQKMITANTGTNAVTISPNPAQDYINFSSIRNIHSIIIFDIKGKIVFTDKLTSSRLSISNLSSGTYFIRILNNNNTFEARSFIKK